MRLTVKLPLHTTAVTFLSEKKIFYSFSQDACFEEWNKDLKRFDENTEDCFLFMGHPFLMSCRDVWRSLMVV